MAIVTTVAQGSPAERAGLTPGFDVTSVNGEPLEDMITWLWESSEGVVEVEGYESIDLAKQFPVTVTLERDWNEQWGLEFDGAVFDGMRICRNNCVFCFMRMLPKGMRRSLYLRDDDYRLSFLQGNFVTLTNLSDEDVERIVEMQLSPLNVSIHALTPEIRRELIGPNEARGREVLQTLLDNGIEIHGQIVLVPGINDGEELKKVLDFAESQPLLESLALVPMGYTRWAPIQRSYSDDPASARDVLEILRPYQERSRRETGLTRFQAADEFYVITGEGIPAAELYDGFPQYDDGVGMLRVFMDETDEAVDEMGAALQETAAALANAHMHGTILGGGAPKSVYERLIARAGLSDVISYLPVENDYFGGNVNVTGLLTAEDILGQLPEDLTGELVIVPTLIFNSDGLTLDDMPEERLVATLEGRGARVIVTETTAASLAELFAHGLEGRLLSAE